MYRGESRSRYVMGGIAGGIHFGTLLSEGRRVVAWVVDGIGGTGR